MHDDPGLTRARARRIVVRVPIQRMPVLVIDADRSAIILIRLPTMVQPKLAYFMHLLYQRNDQDSEKVPDLVFRRKSWWLGHFVTFTPTFVSVSMTLLFLNTLLDSSGVDAAGIPFLTEALATLSVGNAISVFTMIISQVPAGLQSLQWFGKIISNHDPIVFVSRVREHERIMNESSSN